MYLARTKRTRQTGQLFLGGLEEAGEGDLEAEAEASADSEEGCLAEAGQAGGGNNNDAIILQWKKRFSKPESKS